VGGRLIGRMARIAVGCGALVGCLAAVAPAAGAETMVYVKGGQVYVANADGSGARAVTPQSQWWAWPSETDAGVIAVAGGASRVVNGAYNPSGSDQIFEFDQQGKQLSGPVNTEGSYSTVGDPEYVTHFRVAPDNSNVAWTVLPSYADASTSWEKPTGENTFHWTKDSGGGLLPYSSPEWWGNGHLLITHDGTTLFNEAQYAIYSLSDGSAPGWNQDDAIGSAPSYQVTVSRSGLKYAILTDDAANYGGVVHNAAIHFETTSTPPSNPTQINNPGCTITLPASEYSTVNAAQLASMSFSSDGGTLAWGQDDGIYEANVSDPSNCQQITNSVHRVVAGGAEPFLSPAALSPLQQPACGSGGSCPQPPKPKPPTPKPTKVNPPNTRITALVVNSRKRTATVRFVGIGKGKLSFQCKLGRGGWHSCRSPLTLKHLSRGQHRFQVRARGSAGRVDPTPAVKTFRVR
jgi:hypothetical protein